MYIVGSCSGIFPVLCGDVIAYAELDLVVSRMLSHISRNCMALYASLSVDCKNCERLHSNSIVRYAHLYLPNVRNGGF